MKPLQTNKRVLIWLCMCSSNKKDSNLLEKIYRMAFALMIFIFNLWVVVAHLAFFWTFRSTRLDESIFALTNATAFSIVMYIMIYAFFSRHETRRIFKNIRKIYSARAQNIQMEFDFEPCEQYTNYNSTSIQINIKIHFDIWHKQMRLANCCGKFIFWVYFVYSSAL